MTTSPTPPVYELNPALLPPDLPPETQMPHVAMLMCNYHGERLIAEQLNSFERQPHLNWTLVVSDNSAQDVPDINWPFWSQSIKTARDAATPCFKHPEVFA